MNLRRVAVLIVLLMIALFGFTTRKQLIFSTFAPVQSAPTPSVVTRALRPNYPFSVVPGGTYNVGELKAALARDPLARAHYTGFRTESAQVISNDRDRLAYVSYRQNGAIHWTSHPIRIRKGELLISDGVNLARTRCGNRLSANLPKQIAKADPKSAAPAEEADLDMPDLSPEETISGKLPLADTLPEHPHLDRENPMFASLFSPLPGGVAGTSPAAGGAIPGGGSPSVGGGNGSAAPGKSLPASSSQSSKNDEISHNQISRVKPVQVDGGIPEALPLPINTPEPQYVFLTLLVTIGLATRQRWTKITGEGRRPRPRSASDLRESHPAQSDLQSCPRG